MSLITEMTNTQQTHIRTSSIPATTTPSQSNQPKSLATEAQVNNTQQFDRSYVQFEENPMAINLVSSQQIPRSIAQFEQTPQAIMVSNTQQENSTIGNPGIGQNVANKNKVKNPCIKIADEYEYAVDLDSDFEDIFDEKSSIVRHQWRQTTPQNFVSTYKYKRGLRFVNGADGT